MKKQFIILTIYIIVITACNKKNNAVNNNTANTTNSTSAVTITTAPASQNSYKATFQYITSQTLVNKTTGQFTWQFNNASAVFYNNSRINVASVLLNNEVLQYNTAGQYYIINTDSGSTPQWVVNGSQNIPSFSYTPKMPTCLNWNTFPDTIDHTKALSLFIKYDMADQIAPTIYCGGPSSGGGGGFLNTDTATISYPVATMNTYGVGAAQLLITTSYTDKVFVNGVPMSFLSRITFIKPIYIK